MTSYYKKPVNRMYVNASFMKSVILLLSGLLLYSCKQVDMPPLSPQQQILGKWQNVYLGNGEYRPPVKDPSGYREFLADSVLLEYDYASKTTYRRKYWIDSLLHLGSLRQDGFLLRFDYKYRFHKDELELTLVNFSAINHVSKHKRIN
ncbi:MAG: hypothetical protein H7Z72_01915 [Bacteroidetes bacterium]|nr:hypothetical protein [Fibrella sp.]